VARALVTEPKVLLFDEPAVGLSVTRAAQFDTLLRRIRDEHGVTIVMIARERRDRGLGAGRRSPHEPGRARLVPRALRSARSIALSSAVRVRW
jgi:ABC-type taurine transport system ATPase subunit